VTNERDRESIGLTPRTQAILSEIDQKGWFLEGQDIARFSLAYAIRANIQDGATSGTETRWAAGNFDKTGEIRALLAALYPQCQTPVRLMEHLVNEGLQLIARELEKEDLGPADLMT
jgi:hypothetical protein